MQLDSFEYARDAQRHPRLSSSSRSAPHRDLHSFPTRRSSDLLDADRRHRARDREDLRLGEPRDLAGAGHARGELDDLRSEEQRLNSSHVRISYAVFCLKKKKKTTLHHYRYSPQCSGSPYEIDR